MSTPYDVTTERVSVHLLGLKDHVTDLWGICVWTDVSFMCLNIDFRILVGKRLSSGRILHILCTRSKNKKNLAHSAASANFVIPAKLKTAISNCFKKNW